MLQLLKSHPKLDDSFETLTIALTPDNRILVSKKPHSPFHKYKSPDPKPPLPNSASPTELTFALQIQSYLEKFEPTKYTVASLLASHTNCKTIEKEVKPEKTPTFPPPSQT